MVDRVLKVVDQQVRVSVAGGPLVAALAAGAALPFALRAEAALAQIEDIAANAEDAPSVINKVDKYQNGADFDDPEAVLDNLLYRPAGTGAQARALETFLRELAVPVTSFLAPGESIGDDAGPAIRRALATGRPVRFPPGTYVVNYDPTSEFSPGLFRYCITLPENAVLFMEDGALIKGADGLTDWNRVVDIASYDGRSNVRIFGELRIDANVDNISASNNEHMHGLFLYNARDCYIERVHSVNARGDNVFIGGDNDTIGSANIVIGSIYAEKAGRKNLVFQSCRDVVIGSAYLDNLEGGAAIFGGTPDETDGCSLDVEPDEYTGAVRNGAFIGKLITYGAGNDFTAGTTETQANGWTLRVGDFESYVTPRANVPPWVQYGITIEIDRLKISGITSTGAMLSIAYAARLYVSNAEITGSYGDYIAKSELIGSDQPIVRFGTLRLTNSATASTSISGSGWANNNGILDIGDFYPAVSNTALWNRGTTATATLAGATRIGRTFAKNIGEPGWGNYGFLQSINVSAVEPYLELGLVDYEDTRGTKLDRFTYLGTGTGPRVHLGQYVDRSGVEAIKWEAATGYYSTGPRQFVSKGTPESLVPSPVGGTNQRTDGGAATTLYVKESGTSTTGWVAK